MANNQEPRILIFSMTYIPFIGGAEMAVKEITDRLDFEFDLITARLNKKLPKFERIGKINIYRVGRGWLLDKYLFPFLAYCKAKKLHKERNYQIVQAIMAFYAGLAALFFKWKYPKVKYLLTMQSGDSEFFIWVRTWFWYPLYKRIYTDPDYIQAISNFLTNRARRYGYKGEIKILPNGVDLKRFNKDSNDLKFKIGFKSEDNIVITVSRLVKKNGIDDLIRAVADLNVKLLIIGKGKQWLKLKILVRRLRVKNKVFFLDNIGHKYLPKYLAIADVFVRPSLSEGLGSAFLEAMAMGIPVIATPVGGIPDFLIDRETGLFCKVRNPKSIAEKIELLFSDNELREKIVRNARLKIEQEYDWNKIALQMKEIYQSLI